MVYYETGETNSVPMPGSDLVPFTDVTIANLKLEKIKNRNWLEKWRLEKIESQNEKTRTPEKKITRKLVKSNRKKIGETLGNSINIMYNYIFFAFRETPT